VDQLAWVSEGMALLAESGVDAVRVERLADRLATSKASFYWHFRDRPDFLQAVLDSWRNQASRNIPDRTQQTGWDRLRRLMDLPTLGDPSGFGASVELAIRHWAKSDPAAREVVSDVDRLRLAHIGAFLAGSLPADPVDIKARAFLAYAGLLAEAFGAEPVAGANRAAWERSLACFPGEAGGSPTVA
jgi:AcrR family transcriptional regulator